MTAIKSTEGCNLFSAPRAWATRTTIAITNASMAMLNTLTPPPTKNCRNMLLPNGLQLHSNTAHP